MLNLFQHRLKADQFYCQMDSVWYEIDATKNSYLKNSKIESVIN
jgi:hypothetical protein